jgi:hypothetical protein
MKLPSPAADPAGPPTGTYRVARGDSWDSSDPRKARVSHRLWEKPENGRYNLGFRCALVFIPSSSAIVELLAMAIVRGSLSHPSG